MSYLQLSFRASDRDYLIDCFSRHCLILEGIEGRGGMVYSIKDCSGTRFGIYKDSFLSEVKIEIDMRYQNQDWVKSVENMASSVDADANENMSVEEKVEQFIKQLEQAS